MRTLRRAIPLLVLPFTAVAGQSIGVRVAHLDLASQSFPSPNGVGITLEYPILGSRLIWQLGADLSRGQTPTYVGSPCQPLFELGDGCERQSLRSKTNGRTVALGLRVPLLRHARGSLSVIGDVAMQLFQTDVLNSSGATLVSGNRKTFRPDLGLEARVRPLPRRSLSLVAGYAVGQVRASEPSINAAYSPPYDKAMSSRRVWGGVTLPIKLSGYINPP